MGGCSVRVRISKPGSEEGRRSLAIIEMGKIRFSGVLCFGFLGLHADWGFKSMLTVAVAVE